MEEKNAIQKIVDVAISKMQFYARQQRIVMMKMYSWDTKKPYAVDSDSWRETMEKITTEAIISGVSEGIVGVYAIADIQKVSKYFLDFSVDGVTLSNRLRDSAKLAEKLVFDTMNQHIKNKTNFLALTKDFTANKISRGDLPKYLTELADAAKSVGGNTIKINRLINDANKQIAGLKTGGYSQVNLDRAYKKVIDAVKSGDVTTINNALKVAIDQKSVSNNAKIASTETVRANTKATLRKAVDNPLYKKGRVCAKVTLSPAHPLPDICDYYSEVDSYGLGAGVMPVDRAILPDYHPNCRCSWSVIIVDENVSDRDRIAGADDKFYKKVSPEKAKLIKKSNGYLKDWKTGKVEPLPAELVTPI